MQLDTSQPANSSRLRLVDIRIDARGSLRLGPHLSGVLADTSDRTAAAHRIARTVAGPRPDDAGGSVEVEGRTASVWDLPDQYLPAGSPVVIDRAVLDAQWRAAWTRRRNDLAAAHASCRLEGYRIDAALEQERDRVPLSGLPVRAERPAPPPAPAPLRVVERVVAPDVAPRAVDWAQPPDPDTRTRARLRTLIAALDAIEPAPLPEGQALADAWDAHNLLLRARAAADALPAEAVGPGIPVLEERVNAARAAVEQASRDVSEETQARIEQAHRASGEAEAAVFDAKRRRVPAARARHDEVLAAELGILSEAGFDSYASYLFEITGGSGVAGLTGRLAAETELAHARAALDAALQVPSLPTRLDLAEHEVRMRSRATELLGHAPGPEPAAELRALVVEPVGRAETVAEIAKVLSHGGVPGGADVVAAARAFVGESLPAGTAVTPPASAGATVDPARGREVADLEEQRAAQNRKLASLESEMAKIDRITAVEFGKFGGADVAIALEATMAAYRAGALLGGRLPLVLDGVLDGMIREVRESALEVFVRATDVQTVVVTADPEVMQSLSREGGTLVRWPETIVNLVEAEAAELAPSPRRA